MPGVEVYASVGGRRRKKWNLQTKATSNHGAKAEGKKSRVTNITWRNCTAGELAKSWIMLNPIQIRFARQNAPSGWKSSWADAAARSRQGLPCRARGEGLPKFTKFTSEVKCEWCDVVQAITGSIRREAWRTRIHNSNYQRILNQTAARVDGKGTNQDSLDAWDGVELDIDRVRETAYIWACSVQNQDSKFLTSTWISWQVCVFLVKSPACRERWSLWLLSRNFHCSEVITEWFASRLGSNGKLQCCWCAAKPQGRPLRAGAGALFQRGCGMEEAGEGKVRDGRAQDEAREEGQKKNAMEKRAQPIDRIDSNICSVSDTASCTDHPFVAWCAILCNKNVKSDFLPIDSCAITLGKSKILFWHLSSGFDLQQEIFKGQSICCSFQTGWLLRRMVNPNSAIDSIGN